MNILKMKVTEMKIIMINKLRLIHYLMAAKLLFLN